MVFPCLVVQTMPYEPQGREAGASLSSMRFQGKISDWNDERGFGFVTPNGGGPKAFLHISAIKPARSRPGNGFLITYEVEADAKGRLRAIKAQRVRNPARADADKTTVWGTVLASMFLVTSLGLLYVGLSSRTTVKAVAYKVVFAPSALRTNSEFQCRPEKNSCSKMTSCAEAFFHQEKCGVGGMDGDRDGIPCEQQWCR
jgi:cold shock CspA family protein